MGNKKSIQVAIDGPAGAGKSSVAREVARRLGFAYLDTGAMYRVVVYRALALHIDLRDEKAVTDLLADLEIRFEYGEKNRVYCNGEEVTTKIRSREVSKAVSIIAAYRGVRKHLVKIQRREAAKGSLVMDGRDIGTFVLPDAPVKIFLTASVLERARRRHLENIQAGKNSDFQEVLKEIKERDRMDSERTHSPLRPAADALILDTTTLTKEEVVEKIVAICRRHLE